jgi:succinate dehydrogenase / fumarate reductase, cytochrome b subunit
VTPAQAAFLAALGAILLLVGAFGALVVIRARRASRVPASSILARLGRPSVARLELHRWAWYAHRTGGLAILGFLALHLVDVGLVAISPALYDEVHALYGTPALRVFEVGLLAAILFHALDGLRLIVLDLVDVGWRTAERLLWVAVALTVALTIPAAIVILAPVLA